MTDKVIPKDNTRNPAPVVDSKTQWSNDSKVILEGAGKGKEKKTKFFLENSKKTKKFVFDCKCNFCASWSLCAKLSKMRVRIFPRKPMFSIRTSLWARWYVSKTFENGFGKTRAYYLIYPENVFWKIIVPATIISSRKKK